MPTQTSEFLGKDPIDTYVPVPFPPDFHSTGGSQGGGSGDTGGGQGDGSTNVTASFFTATCLASDNVGAFVRVTDTQNAVTTTTSGLSYPSVGLIVSKTNATTCVVQTYGLCVGVYQSLVPNVRMFVGPTGLATAASSLPSGTAYVQPVAFAVRANALFVQPSGILYRRDATADPSDPAPPPAGDGTTTYRPILHGTGSPDDSIGQLGDSYIATDTLLLYDRGDDGWSDPRPLGQSQPGPKGDPGTPGSRIYRVATLPPDGSGYAAGDLLFDDAGNVAQIEST